jgi:GNAT superfamily N-acetyltransferase
VIEVDEGLVALVVLDAGWIAQLYVDPEWTGRGLGSRLVNLAKELHPNGLDLCAWRKGGSPATAPAEVTGTAVRRRSSTRETRDPVVFRYLPPPISPGGSP